MDFTLCYGKKLMVVEDILQTWDTLFLEKWTCLSLIYGGLKGYGNSNALSKKIFMLFSINQNVPMWDYAKKGIGGA